MKHLVFILALFFCADLAKAYQQKEHDLNEKPVIINIFSKNRMQKITHWGHDIKQDGKAVNLTAEACQQIFKDGRFNLLRIPIYSNAHNDDGSVRKDYFVRLINDSFKDGSLLWEMELSDDGYCFIRNVLHNKYLQALKPGNGWGYSSTLELIDKEHKGSSLSEWKLIDAGNGLFQLKSKAHDMLLRGSDTNDVGLVKNSTETDHTLWKVLKAENGFIYIQRKGSEAFLKGGGSQYDVIVEAIKNAKEYGKPQLFASHKIWDSNDHSTFRNINFNNFYTDKRKVDTKGFAASIDAFIDFIKSETGEEVKYLAPRCELGNHWSQEDFADIVERLVNKPLIVGPDAAWAINSEKFLTPEIKKLIDISATHNKEQSPMWPDGIEYKWNSETLGGNHDHLIKHFFELNESFYKGKVEGVVFWGDVHLYNTNGGGKNGAFRRELVDASKFYLVECDKSFDQQASAIAFETNKKNEIKVFYCSTKDIRFQFDRQFKKSDIPKDAFNILENSFEMRATGKSEYATFIIKLKD